MRYKLFDITAAGDKIDTGKVVSMASVNDAVKEVFKCYDFKNYADSYRVVPSGNDAYITYTYQDGVKNTWFIERIVE